MLILMKMDREGLELCRRGFPHHVRFHVDTIKVISRSHSGSCCSVYH